MIVEKCSSTHKIVTLNGGVTMSDKGIIVIYNTKLSGTKVEVKLIDGNLWLSQEQIESLYNSSTVGQYLLQGRNFS